MVTDPGVVGSAPLFDDAAPVLPAGWDALLLFFAELPLLPLLPHAASSAAAASAAEAA
jgi:hypothetical protein